MCEHRTIQWNGAVGTSVNRAPHTHMMHTLTDCARPASQPESFRWPVAAELVVCLKYKITFHPACSGARVRQRWVDVSDNGFHGCRLRRGARAHLRCAKMMRRNYFIHVVVV